VYFSKSKGEFLAEVNVNSRQKYFKASARSLDVYQAVDAVAERLLKQFLRMRKVHTNHKKFELSKGGKLRGLNAQLEPKTRLRKAA